MLLLRAFTTFSKASGLEMNRSKSELYFNGVSALLIEEILLVSGCKQGKLPFRYLGVPISHKKLTRNECNVLVDRIVGRIRGWGARKLSYAGRLVLVQTVLSTLHNYWASIFVIPNGVIKAIESICRNYLWEGHVEYSKAPLVAWETCCLSKQAGGLGIVNAKRWNYAAIGKLVWWIYEKADHLWIRWVNSIYLNHEEWKSYSSSINSSWAWRKICQVKNKLIGAYFANKWLGGQRSYSVKGGYIWFQGVVNEVNWYRSVWDKLSIPKHSFISWLGMHQRLLTSDRLIKMGIQCNEECYLCQNAKETHHHLFYECSFSSRCLTGISNWLGLQLPISDTREWCIRKSMKNSMMRKIVWVAMNALTYHIWLMRNQARLHGFVARPSILVRSIQQECQVRCKQSVQGRLKDRMMNWLQDKELL